MTSAMVVLACAADLLLGDPRWFPHPVRLMGRVIAWSERVVRACGRGAAREYVAGVVMALLIPAAAFAATWGLLDAARAFDPLAGQVTWIVLAWTTLAARDLADHVLVVRRALEAGRLEEARLAVGRVVGRDTAGLPEEEIIRAATETVAEGAADGVVAPLFYLALGGPSLAMAFKAVSTLDSTIGYRDARHRRLGWASARLDDLANWIPARLTAGLLVLSAGLLQRSLRRMAVAARVLRRDRRNHPSPNSGWPEAAMAGALGVRLGGVNVYQGRREPRPPLGDPLVPLTPATIREAVGHLWGSAALALVIAVLWLSW